MNQQGYLTIELAIIIPLLLIILIVFSLFQVYFFQKAYLQMRLNYETLTEDTIVMEKQLKVINLHQTITSEFQMDPLMERLYFHQQKQELKEWLHE
jgi:hypothetical protein